MTHALMRPTGDALRRSGALPAISCAGCVPLSRPGNVRRGAVARLQALERVARIAGASRTSDSTFANHSDGRVEIHAQACVLKLGPQPAMMAELKALHYLPGVGVDATSLV
jgi:hypothetical protein